MGVGIGTALLIGAGIGTAGAIAGSAVSSHGAQEANEDAMDFNSWQADINRKWQSNMYERQRQDQENFYQKYQSPEAIGKALSGLGVNPATVFSGQSLGGSVPSMPSVPSGSQASIGSLLNPLEPYAEGMRGVTTQAAQMIGAMSDSKLKDAQTIHVLKQAYGQEFTNQMLEISAQVATWQIPEKAKADINDLMASAALKNANSKLVEAQTDVEKIMKIIRQNDAKIGSQQILEMSIRLAHLDQLLSNQEQLGTQQIKTEKSIQSRNYAEGRLASANAKTVNDIRADVVRYHKALANITDTRDFVSSNTAWNEVQQSLYELQAAKLIPQEMMQEIENAKKRNDWYEVNQLLGIADEGLKAYGTYYGAKTGRGFVDAQDTRNKIDADFKDWQKSKSGQTRSYTPSAPWSTYGR